MNNLCGNSKLLILNLYEANLNKTKNYMLNNCSLYYLLKTYCSKNIWKKKFALFVNKIVLKEAWNTVFFNSYKYVKLGFCIAQYFPALRQVFHLSLLCYSHTFSPLFSITYFFFLLWSSRPTSLSFLYKPFISLFIHLYVPILPRCPIFSLHNLANQFQVLSLLWMRIKVNFKS